MPPTLFHRTLGNAAVLTVGAAVEMVLQFVFLVLAGRGLGPAEFGFYGYLIAIVALAVTIAHFGLPVVAVREFAQRPQEENHIFAATFRIRAAFSVLFFVGAVLAAVLLPQSGEHRTTLWVMFLYLLFIPFDLSPLFDARKMSRWDVPGKVAGRATALLVLLAALWIRGYLTIVDVAVASSALMLVNVVVGWRVARRLGFSLRPFAATTETGKLARASLPLVWSNVMMVAYLQSQTVLVKWLSTSLETGYYALANRLFMPVLMLKGIMYRLLLPILSDVGRDRAALTTSLERILPALALIFMPLSVLAIIAAEVLIVPVFGVEYAGAVRPFQISVSFLFFTGMSSAMGTALLANGDARTPTVGLTIGCAASIGLCFLLIPRYGAVGAAWATVAAEILSNVYTLPKFLRLSQPAILPRLWKIGAASLAGLLIYYAAIASTGVPLALAFVLATVVVTVGLWMAGEISRARIRTIQGLVRSIVAR